MALTDTITSKGSNAYFDSNLGVNQAALQLTPVETVSASGAVSIWGVSYINSAAAATNVTLADGEIVGQIKIVSMTEASNSSTLTIAHHVTSDPEVLIFAQVGDLVMLIWSGADWATVHNNGAATS